MTNLVTWGYPYVGDKFRFHMTVTDRVPEDGRAAIRAVLKERFEPYLSEDYHIDALSLLVQKHRNADFVCPLDVTPVRQHCWIRTIVCRSPSGIFAAPMRFVSATLTGSTSWFEPANQSARCEDVNMFEEPVKMN